MGTDAAPTEAPARPPSGARCPCCGAVVPTHRGDRRLTLLDVMILVAASALAALLVRPVLAGPLRTYPSWSTYLAVAIGGLVAWTPAVLFLRLRRPRPNLRRLTSQPGFAASLAGTMVVALGLLATGLLALVRASLFGSAARAGVRPTPPDPSWWICVVLHFGAVVGPAVLGAWRARPDREGDRGRLDRPVRHQRLRPAGILAAVSLDWRRERPGTPLPPARSQPDDMGHAADHRRA